MRIFALWLLVFLSFAVSLCAQIPRNGTPSPKAPSKPELPAGPLLHAADAFSRWVVSFTYADDKKADLSAANTPLSPSDKRLRKSTTTKTDRIIHEEISDVFNRRSDIWFNGQMQYSKSGSSPIWYQSEAGARGDDANYIPLPANGYRNLDWITPDNFAGTVATSDGRQCLVFAPGGYQKLDLSDASRNDKMAGAEVIAYIDSDTRLPIMVRAREETRIYHFEAAPTEMQTLPTDLTDQIKKGAEARARMLQPAPRPY